MISKENWLKAQEIFEQALDLPVSERQGFVQSCCDDPNLAAKIEQMLNFADTKNDALHVAVEGAVSFLENPESLLGQKIGSYRLIQVLGQGGMGGVYLAERDDMEFRHRVAIKMIKRNLNHPALQSLFQNERQILADMNHPYICRLMDGGRTENGQIYIVMEYVAGLPIDQHCEENKFSIRARLEIFLKVCATVQALHQKLVIHCDLKPTNILVNDSGDPKLLDFGIAQATSRHSSEALALTGGYTLEYSSPEQILGERPDVTSDVYSLGMLLYKILSGRSPAALNIQDLTAIHEARRPPDDWKKVAQDHIRRMDSPAEGVHPQLFGIYRRASQLNPELRYPTVESLIGDVQRYLTNLPIRSMPAPLLYRALCWFRRNRFLAITVAVFCVLSATWFYREHRLKEKVEQTDQVNREVSNFLANIFRDIDPYSYKGKTLSGIDILDNALVQIGQSTKLGTDMAGRLKLRLAASYRALGSTEKAEKTLLSALQAEQSEATPSQERVATLYGALGENARLVYQDEKAKDWFNKAELLWSSLEKTPSYFAFAHDYSIFMLEFSNTDKAAELNQAVLDFCLSKPEDMQDICLTAEHNKARILGHQNRVDEAIGQFESALSHQKQHYGERSLHILHTLSSYVQMLRGHSRLSGLEHKMLDMVALVKEIHPPGHPYRNQVLNILANYYHDQAQYPQAIAIYKQMLAETESSPHKDSFFFAGTLTNLAMVYSEMEVYDKAWLLSQRFSRLQQELFPEDGTKESHGYQQLGSVALLKGDFDNAENFLQKALAIRLKSADSMSVALTYEQLALLNSQMGRLELAQDYMKNAWSHVKGKFVERDMREAQLLATDAQIKHALGAENEALEKINQALDIVRGARSERHPIYAKYLLEKSGFSANKADLKEAIAILERAVPAKAPSLVLARGILRDKFPE